jgi:pyrroline-5-carboxylate reductase
MDKHNGVMRRPLLHSSGQKYLAILEISMAFELALIGAGNMAEAIARGIVKNGVYTAGQLIASDPNPDRREYFQRELGISTVEHSAEAAAMATGCLLAVKPQKIDDALTEIRPVVRKNSLVLSIVSAITTAYIEKQLAAHSVRVVRIMPNTPMLVGAGASGICRGQLAQPEDVQLARRIFGTCGVAVEMPESLMDAVTSLSGCGPAYVFYLVEAMTQAGEKQGLPADAAALLARQTIIGAGRLLEQSPDSAAELRRKVTSPGGFTEAAIKYFDAHGLAGLIEQGMNAALQRGKELSR